MTTFSNDAQLREEDGDLFHYSDVSWARKHVRAAEDLVRDLKGHGYLQDARHVVLDESATATVALTFEATIDGPLTVPAGTMVADTAMHGAVRFRTDEQLVVLAGDSGTVAATAESFGEVYNVGAGALVVVEQLVNLAGVVNDAAAGGRDHQLTRAAVYRAMELIMQDLLRAPDDSFEHRRKMYRASYQDELDRLVGGGIQVDANADGAPDAALQHGFHRFRRG